MTPEDEKTKRLLIIGLIVIWWVVIIVIATRADSTFVPKREICRIDTIYVDDPRCGRLDSTYVLPHDTTIIGLIVRVEGHWEWYNWINGKRVDMRRIKQWN